MRNKNKMIMAVTMIAILAICSLTVIYEDNNDSDASSAVTKNLTVGTSFVWYTGVPDSDTFPSWTQGTLPPGISADLYVSSSQLYFHGTPTTSGTYVVSIYHIDDVTTGEDSYVYMVVTFVVAAGAAETYTHTATLVYDANGGSGVPASQTASITSSSATATGSNTFILSSIVPIKTGYAFNGWFSVASAASGKMGGSTQIVNYGSTITMYAIWTAEATSYTHTLRYVSDYEEIFTAQTVTNTESVTTILVTLDIPEKTGYTFLYWHTSASSSVLIYPGETVNVGTTVSLIATWDLIQTFTVTYDANGGTGSIASITVEENTAITLPSDGFTYTDKLLKGWTNGDGDTVLELGSTVTVTSNIIYSAVWVDNTDPVASFTYAIAGMKVTFSDTSIAPNIWQWSFGDTTTSTSQNPVHTYTEANTYTVTLTITNATDKTSTYSAIVTVGGSPSTQYTVTFNVNGGTEIEAVTATNDTDIILGSAVKDGYAFGGWYYNGILVGNEGSQYTITGNITLSATWVSSSTVFYTVTFTADDETVSTQRVATGGHATNIDCDVNGFTGNWFYADEYWNFGTAVTSNMELVAEIESEPISTTSDLILYIAIAIMVIAVIGGIIWLKG